jgi:hypothetical protein
MPRLSNGIEKSSGGAFLTNSQVPNDLTTCATLLDRAVALAPNLAIAWNFSGWIRIYLGEAEVAIDGTRHASLDELLVKIKSELHELRPLIDLDAIREQRGGSVTGSRSSTNGSEAG